MKKFVYAFMACALLVLPFTSCSDDDDDDDEKVEIPVEVVTNLSFTDTDMDPDKIGGTLSWTVPSSEENISGYVIYQGETSTDKKTRLGEVEKGKTSFDILTGTDYAGYLLIVAKNIAGESDKIASIAVKDNSGDPIVTDVAFTDTDKTYQKIGGILTWKLPEPERDITGYVIYGSNDAVTKGNKLGEVGAGVSSFIVPEGTPYLAYLQVVTLTGSEESENISYVAVKDIFEENTQLLILNGGNSNENNASISYYDIATGSLTANFYREANGRGLGDSAEQILAYGDKIYVTVTASNRLVILQKDGKEIKSIEPKNGENPLNPRCMVADNGKVYVSYFYGHSVAVLDTASLAIEKVVPVGRYPEQLAVSKGNIYVANSGGLDYPDYGNTVSVINQTSMKVEKEIEVLINPTKVLSDSQGDIYVISTGDYGEVKNTLQRIDGSTGEVTVMDYATCMAIGNNKLYAVYAQWGAPEITYKIYDTLTEKVIDNNFIKDGTDISSPYAITVDPITEAFYITESAWGSTGSLYAFSADGKLQGSPLDTKGYEPKSMVLITK